MSTCARNLPQHFNGCTCAATASVAAEVVDVTLSPQDPYADLSATAVLNAVAEAKRTGKPALVDHPSVNRIELDEQRTGSMAGDYSIGAEPSIRYTWATGDDEAPFITVTETAWVSARLRNNDGPALDNLDYEDWEDAKESREMWESDRSNMAGNATLPAEPPSILYGRESITEWIAHTDPNDPGGTEVNSDYEHGEGSALFFSSLANAESDSRRYLKSLDPSMYSPENWK